MANNKKRKKPSGQNQSKALKLNENKPLDIAAKAEAKAEALVNKSENASKKKDSGAKKPNPVVKYFKDLKSEFKKVVWPTKKAVINNTGIVLAAMIISGLFIWGVDTVFTSLLRLLVSQAG